MSQLTLPQDLLNDLKKFINKFNHVKLPNGTTMPSTHPLLIAQAFILKYQDYGKKYGLPAITNAVEHMIGQRIWPSDKK